MDKPRWGKRSDKKRLDWLLENCKMAGFTGNKNMDRKAIDDAIARDEYRVATKRGEKRG